MDNKTVIEQLKKALAEKDNPKLRVRLEVMIDMLEGQLNTPQAAQNRPQGTFTPQPVPVINSAQNVQPAASQTPINATTGKKIENGTVMEPMQQGEAGRSRQLSTGKPPVGVA